MTRKIAVDIIASLCLFLFAYAAVSKLLDYETFAAQIGQSPILTDYSAFLAWWVPAVELLISLLLVFPSTRIIGLYAFFSVMIMFTAYIILASRFTDYVPCSCGGVLQNMTWNEHLYFNAVFILLALAAIILDPSWRRRIESSQPKKASV